MSKLEEKLSKIFTINNIEKPDKKKDFLYLAILISIALAIGIYLIATTVFIAKDGVSYIRQAEEFSRTPAAVFKNSHSFGYVFLIFVIHRFVSLFADCSSVYIWIYSAQSATLLLRTLALIWLYFIGKFLVGRKTSFWAILILVILPFPARFGSDTVRVWPYILFLAAGFWFLLWGAKENKWWMFGAAGLAAGAGQTIRPECFQLVLYGLLWLSIKLLLPKSQTDGRKAVCAALLALIIGFAIPAAPYIKARGTIAQGKLKRLFSNSTPDKLQKAQEYDTADRKHIYLSSNLPVNITKSIGKLVEETNDNLFYFFLPAFLIGIYHRFRKGPSLTIIERFFIPAFAFFNVVMLTALYCKFDHISRRHCLPLVALLIFYVPTGLQVIANWLDKNFSRAQAANNTPMWFFILLITGIIICSFKLLHPLRTDKQGYRDAANWLRKNTGPKNTIVAADERICLYAERQALIYSSEQLPGQPFYIIKAGTNEDKEAKLYKTAQKTTNKKIAAQSSAISQEKCFLKGLVGYWPADSDARDHCLYSNDGTFYGQPAYKEGKRGQAFSFSRKSKNYVNCGKNSSLNPTSSMTISAWIYPISASRGTIVSKNGPYIMEIYSDLRIHCGILAGFPATWTHTASTSAIAVNSWHHIVMTYDGSYIRIYTDGSQDGRPTAKTGDMALTTSELMIGFGTPGVNHYFDGLIDEVMIFSRVLSPEEIEALYNEGPQAEIIPRRKYKISEEYKVWMDKRKKGVVVIYKVLPE